MLNMRECMGRGHEILHPSAFFRIWEEIEDSFLNMHKVGRSTVKFLVAYVLTRLKDEPGGREEMAFFR